MVQSIINRETNDGFGGSNMDINKRLHNTYNQWTRQHDDPCAYTNEQRILRKPIKYYTNRVWAPGPTGSVNDSDFSYFTAIGNQKGYNVKNNLVYPEIGELTSKGNKKFIQYILPFQTSPLLGSNTVNTTDIDTSSRFLRIGEPTNLNYLTKDVTTAVDYDRWEFVDPNIVQNPDNIIFANGVIPRGGISTRNELQNYSEIENC